MGREVGVNEGMIRTKEISDGEDQWPRKSQDYGGSVGLSFKTWIFSPLCVAVKMYWKFSQILQKQALIGVEQWH